MYIRPAWAEINFNHLISNMNQFRKLLKPKTKLCTVIKANAYGHGLIPIANAVLANNSDYLAVAILNEGIKLRQAGITKPILILGFVPPSQAASAISHNLTTTVYCKDFAIKLSDAAKALNSTAKIHLKIDTGMSRIGIFPKETLDFINFCQKLHNIFIEGIFSHFATADSGDKTYALMQLKTFQNLLSKLQKEKIHIPIKHIANTAAIMDLPQAQLDMVRLGIGLYGYSPSNEMEKFLDLKPVMSLKCHIAHIKEVAKNTNISYGATFNTKKTSRIATLPIGYADGYARGLSNKANVIINGQKAPVCGRVCMDQCMIDISDIPNVDLNTEVTLFNHEIITANNLAEHLNTIPYEVLCMISKRIPRIYI